MKQDRSFEGRNQILTLPLKGEHAMGRFPQPWSCAHTLPDKADPADPSLGLQLGAE